MADGVDFLVHQRLDLERPRIADDDEPAIIADEVRELMVPKDQRIGLEDRRFGRVVDMGLDLVARLGLQLTHQRMQDTERLQIVLLLRHGLEEGFQAGPSGVLHDRERVGDQEAAERGADDDDEFPRLEEHVDVAAKRHKATQHAAECHR